METRKVIIRVSRVQESLLTLLSTSGSIESFINTFTPQDDILSDIASMDLDDDVRHDALRVRQKYLRQMVRFPHVHTLYSCIA